MAPIPLIIGFGLGVTYFLRQHKKAFYTAITSVLFLISYWFYAHYGISNYSFSEKNNAVLFWNIADQEFLPRPLIEKALATYNPDIIAFVETKKLSVADLRFLNERLPEHDIRILKGYMFIAIRGEIQSTKYIHLKEKSKFNYIKATMHNKTISIVLADVYASPFQNKKTPLDSIYNFSLSKAADLVFGDFNTPYESIYFKPYKKEYSSFHDVSNGFTATWPIGIPLLELDQIWVSGEIKALHLEKEYSTSSDHAMLIGSFKLISKPN